MGETYTLLCSNDGILENILYTHGDRTIPILGDNGKKRELQSIESLRKYEEKYHSILPIFIGFGAGFAITEYSKTKKPFVIIDLESLSTLTKDIHNIDTEHALIITHGTFKEHLPLLDSLMHQLQYPLCIPIIHPFIKEHFTERYRPYIDRARELARYNPFGRTRYSVFKKQEPTILCLWQSSFISQALTYAMKKEDINYIEIPLSSHESTVTLIPRIIEAIQRHQPDFILTLNHTGFDTSNVIATILHLFQIPIASWFMDSPELDVERQDILLNKNLTVFTYDEKNIPYLNSIGISNAYYLPLATNIEQFTPKPIPDAYTSWRAIIGFLGDSRTTSIHDYQKHAYTPMLHLYSKEIAETFRTSPLYTVQEVIESEYNFLYQEFLTLPLPERRDYIQLILDFATRTKRTLALTHATIVQSTILGDTAWQELITPHVPAYINGGIPYNDALYLYSQVEMVLNSTSTQMKDAVNQRVFDCPIAGTLVLTEQTKQLEKLFDIGIEVVCYSTDEELVEKITYYHTHIQERMDIIHKAQRRIEMQHTWGHRIQTILSTMKKLYG